LSLRGITPRATIILIVSVFAIFLGLSGSIYYSYFSSLTGVFSYIWVALSKALSLSGAFIILLSFLRMGIETRSDIILLISVIIVILLSVFLGNPYTILPSLIISIMLIFAREQNLTKTMTSHLPSKPERPSGPSSARINQNLLYSTIYHSRVAYIFDWGDGMVTQIGPRDAGQTVTQGKTYHYPGNYSIKVKVRDINGRESPFSDPLNVAIIL
jgi:hypothetical protein